jgi:hypothetical protein
LWPVAFTGVYPMMKTSKGIVHWTVCEHINGEGHRALYVKIFVRLPHAPIKVKIKICDDRGKTVCLTANVDACCATDSLENALRSGNFLFVHGNHLNKWNGGSEVDDDGDYKNIELSVNVGV